MNSLVIKMKRQIVLSFVMGFLFMLPSLTFAVTAPTDLKSFATLVVDILKGATGILFASLAVGLVYGVVLYLANPDNEQKREQIKGYLLWAVIGIAVAFGLWGILVILSNTFGLSGVGIPLIRPPSP